MWHRTKRLINSYLDDLINRVSSPDREMRGITRDEITRLNELEVQTRASVKVLEKELADVGLKILGAIERERILRERGDEASATAAASQVATLSAQRDLITQQIAEATAAAERARSLREERKREGEDLATETQLTAMRENLSSVHAPFSSTDPAGTIDEMRDRLRRSGARPTDSRVAEADRELEAERARARVEATLSRYKQGGSPLEEKPTAPTTTNAASNQTPAPSEKPETESGDQPKTLGRSDGPIRPID